MPHHAMSAEPNVTPMLDVMLVLLVIFVPASALASRIHSIYDRRPEKILQVSGDRRATYDAIVHAMDVAKGAGVRVIAVSPRAIGTQ